MGTMLLFYTVYSLHVSKIYYHKVSGSKVSDFSDFLNWTVRTTIRFL